MGLTFAGTSLGGALMTMVGNVAIAHGGWRAGYVTLAIPMFVIVIPLIIIVVRTRPPQAEGVSVSQASDALPGFEMREAIHTRSFWMISAAQFFFAAVAAGTGLHLITYFTELGYTPSFAAGMMSLAYIAAAFGKLGMGLIADRISARIALTFNFFATCLGMLLIFGAGRTAVLIPFVLIFGLALGAPLVLVPMLIAESLGLKRFGSIGGITGIFNTLGAFVGPVGAGKIYGLHLITYLTELGYAPSFAAGMMSLAYIAAAFGKLGMGLIADRISARIALTINFFATCLGMLLIFGAARTAVLIPFVLIFGLSLGAPLVLVPMLIAESLGLKRFGSIGGITGIFNTLGAFVGPVGAGKIYDLTGSYTSAFEAFVVMCLIGAAVTYSCRTLESEQSRQSATPIPATA